MRTLFLLFSNDGLTVSGLRGGCEQPRAVGDHNVTRDDAEWNYEGTRVAFGQGSNEEAQASHEFMVDLFYDQLLSAIRLPAP